MELLRKYLYVLLMAMLPLVELRGSIILGSTMELPWIQTYIISVIGNMIPVPFILMFIRKIIQWMKNIKRLDKIAVWLENKAHKNTEKILKYATFGLFLFVAVPLPGTGAWTGSLAAALLDMRMKYALPSIFAGVMVAGFIMTGVSYGFIGFLDFIM